MTPRVTRTHTHIQKACAQPQFSQSQAILCMAGFPRNVESQQRRVISCKISGSLGGLLPSTQTTTAPYWRTTTATTTTTTTTTTTITTTLPLPHYHYHTLTTTLSLPHYHYHTTTATLPLPHYHYHCHTTTTTLPLPV